jgi:hypothetical protein
MTTVLRKSPMEVIMKNCERPMRPCMAKNEIEDLIKLYSMCAARREQVHMLAIGQTIQIGEPMIKETIFDEEIQKECK